MRLTSDRRSPQRRQSEGYRREKRAQEADRTTEGVNSANVARLLLEKAHPPAKHYCIRFRSRAIKITRKCSVIGLSSPYHFCGEDQRIGPVRVTKLNPTVMRAFYPRVTDAQQ